MYSTFELGILILGTCFVYLCTMILISNDSLRMYKILSRFSSPSVSVYNIWKHITHVDNIISRTSREEILNKLDSNENNREKKRWGEIHLHVFNCFPPRVIDCYAVLFFFFFYEKPFDLRPISCRKRYDGVTNARILFAFFPSRPSERLCTRLKDCRTAGGAQIYIPRALSCVPFSFFFFFFFFCLQTFRVIYARNTSRLGFEVV